MFSLHCTNQVFANKIIGQANKIIGQANTVIRKMKHACKTKKACTLPS